LDGTPKAQATRAKQVGLHQTKKLLQAKQSLNKRKGRPTEWEKIFANLI